VEAIEGNFPMVVVKGSGRVADIICAIRERQSDRFVQNQCKGDLPPAMVDGVTSNAYLQSPQSRFRAHQEMQRVRLAPGSSGCLALTLPSRLTAGRYKNLHVLDLNWAGQEWFVNFVHDHIRKYSLEKQAKQYRSSHFTELFEFLREAKPSAQHSGPAPLLTLERDEKNPFAIWSLTFGIAQVDSDRAFERVLTFEQQGSQSSMKCAEAAVKVMRLMFPLPVAIVSTIGKMDVPNEKDPVTAAIHNFLKEVKPFYVWSIAVAGADAFEILVHVVNPKQKGKIKCTFKGLGGILVHEMQVAISNLLHKDYGVVPFAFAQMPTSPDSAKPSKPFSDFIDNISSSCLQCTKVLLIAAPPSVSQPAELFMLEQVTCDV
jgi:hypothetical protein